MAVTVREALKIWPLTQAQLLAGAGGLDREISWAHIVEVFDDPYFLSPGILLCSTGYGFKENPALQASVMREADRVGVAAILMKTGYELLTIPEEMLAAADASDIPFLKFPQSIPFSDVTRSMAGPLLRAETESFKKGRQMLRRLMDAQVSGGGFPAIARVLGESLGCSAFVTNRMGHMLATHLAPATEGPEGDGGGPGISSVAHLGHYSQKIGASASLDSLFRLNRIVALPSERASSGTAAFITPIRFEGRMRGFVGVVREPGLTDLTHWAVETAALVAAAEYRALRVEESTEQRLAGNLLDALIGDAQEPDPHLLDRLAAWGYDVFRPCRVVLLEIDPGESVVRKRRSLSHLRPLFDAYCGSEGCEPVVRFLDRSAIALRQAVDVDPNRERETLSEFRDKVVQRLPGAAVWVTTGRPVAPASGLHGTYDESVRAMTVIRRTQPSGGALCAEDLGLDNVLIDLAGSQRVLDYVREVLGPILTVEPIQSRTRLLETLRTYLATDADTQATAEQMYLHANTVRYRLRAVEDLTGLSLRSSNDRTLLTVALRLLELEEQVPVGTRGDDPSRRPT